MCPLKITSFAELPENLRERALRTELRVAPRRFGVQKCLKESPGAGAVGYALSQCCAFQVANSASRTSKMLPWTSERSRG